MDGKTPTEKPDHHLRATHARKHEFQGSWSSKNSRKTVEESRGGRGDISETTLREPLEWTLEVIQLNYTVIYNNSDKKRELELRHIPL